MLLMIAAGNRRGDRPDALAGLFPRVLRALDFRGAGSDGRLLAYRDLRTMQLGRDVVGNIAACGGLACWLGHGDQHRLLRFVPQPAAQ
jgi:hypothetical protein